MNSLVSCVVDFSVKQFVLCVIWFSGSVFKNEYEMPITKQITVQQFHSSNGWVLINPCKVAKYPH